MKDKRKQWVNRLQNNIFVNPPPLPLLCESSGALHLARLAGWQAGRLAGRRNIVSRSQTAFLAQGVIACSISARTQKGSGMVHSADSFLTPPQVRRC